MTTTTAPGFPTRKVRRSSRTESSRVAPSSQNEWQRYMPRLPWPLNPSRSRMRSAASTAVRAHAVQLARFAELGVAPEEGPHLAVRQQVAVVRVDHQAADAVVELAGDRLLLLDEYQPGSGTDIELCVIASATRLKGRSQSSSWPLQPPAAGAAVVVPPRAEEHHHDGEDHGHGTTAIARRRTSKRLSGPGAARRSARSSGL